MTALRSRLDCLEKAQVQKVHGRFIYVRSGSCTEQEAHGYLRSLGITVGPRDLGLSEQHGEYVDPPVAPGESLTLTIILSHECTEDALVRLDEEPICAT